MRFLLLCKAAWGSDFSSARIEGALIDEFDTITDAANAKDRADDIDRHNRAMAGHETGDGSAHHLLQQTALEITSNGGSRRRQEQQSSKDIWRIVLDGQLADIQALIDGYETDFLNKHGEAWREELALEILEPDMIPQRRDDESMDDYRARVEQALMDELLNEDGTIKDKYKDHPDYGQYAQWAQSKYDQQQAQAFDMAMNDPSLSDQQQDKLIEDYMQSATYQRTIKAAAKANPDSQNGTALNSARDQLNDAESAELASLTEDSFAP